MIPNLTNSMMYRPTTFSLLPPVVKNLLIINGLFYLATVVLQSQGLDLIAYLALFFPASPYFEPYQLISHLFMHGSFGHLFSNMLALWMFGTPMENLWGPKRFLTYYFVTGLGAAACHLAVNAWDYSQWLSLANLGDYNAAVYLEQLLSTPTVGASGAVFGLLLAYGMTFPNQEIYVYFLLPIKAKYFVAIYGLFELFSGLSNSGSNIAHFAHLGGMLFGFLLIRHWRKNAYRF